MREVTLLGQNVNAYGLDLRGGGEAGAPAFAELLARLDAVEGLERVRFMTSHPKDLGDDLVAAVAELPSVCEHVHLPAQAGSDRVLRAMRRGYTSGEYLERVHALREAVPDVSITTDLIAGFPGETDDDFERTMDLVREARFDAAFTFVYSPRSGTRAADLPDQVPKEVRTRARRAPDRSSRSSRRWPRTARGSGGPREVLVEGASRDGEQHRGRTRQNVTVNIAGAVEPGAIVTVEITAATSTTLRGTV